MPFPFFQNPVDFAHLASLPFAKRGSSVVDATAGNGKDALFLGELVLSETEGELFCIDIQEEALRQTKRRLEETLSKEQLKRVYLINQSHAHFPEEVQNISLFVYNLGYLPGGDKEVVSEVKTTLESVECALSRLKTGGALSITCYPGHAEGAREEEALLEFFCTLNQRKFQVSFTRWVNRNSSPSHFLVQKENPAL